MKKDGSLALQRQKTYMNQSGVKNKITKIDYWGLATENIRINQK